MIDLAAPRRSPATGTFAGEGLDILERWGLPVGIDKVRLKAVGHTATLRDSVVKVAGQRIAVSGDITIRPETFAVDLKASADEVDADRLLQAVPPGAGKAGKAKPSAWDVPLEGRVAVAAKSIAFGKHTVQSVAGTVRLAPKQVVVDVGEARLCHFTIPHKVTFTPGAATVAGRIEAREAPLAEVVPCVLVDKALAMTGTLHADVAYTASGPPEELAHRLTGWFRGTARAGRIKHSSVGRILEHDVIAPRVDADEAALATARGLAYSEIAVAGTLQPGRVRIERFTLDGPFLGIGMTGEINLDNGELGLRGVAAPFGAATAMIRRVPVPGRLFGQRLVGAPFSVNGDWHEPRVLPLAPGAIAGSMVDFLSRKLNAPIDLLSPLLTSPEPAP